MHAVMNRTDRTGSKPQARVTRAFLYSLGGEPADNLNDTTSAEARIAMMWSLALKAWTVAGRALPMYARQAMPVRIIARERPPSAAAG